MFSYHTVPYRRCGDQPGTAPCTRRGEAPASPPQPTRPLCSCVTDVQKQVQHELRRQRNNVLPRVTAAKTSRPIDSSKTGKSGRTMKHSPPPPQQTRRQCRHATPLARPNKHIADTCNLGTQTGTATSMPGARQCLYQK